MKTIIAPTGCSPLCWPSGSQSLKHVGFQCNRFVQGQVSCPVQQLNVGRKTMNVRLASSQLAPLENKFGVVEPPLHPMWLSGTFYIPLISRAQNVRWLAKPRGCSHSIMDGREWQRNVISPVRQQALSKLHNLTLSVSTVGERSKGYSNAYNNAA